MNGTKHAGGVSVEHDPKETPACCGLAFESVRVLLRAGELLKEAGFDVLVVPRRTLNCGVLLLVQQRFAAAALSALARQAIKPDDVLPYELPQEAVDE